MESLLDGGGTGELVAVHNDADVLAREGINTFYYVRELLIPGEWSNSAVQLRIPGKI